MEIKVRIKTATKGMFPRLQAYQAQGRMGIVVGKYDLGYGETWGVRFLDMKGHKNKSMRHIDYFPRDHLEVISEDTGKS
jgi:hypothetical protein